MKTIFTAFVLCCLVQAASAQSRYLFGWQFAPNVADTAHAYTAKNMGFNTFHVGAGYNSGDHSFAQNAQVWHQLTNGFMIIDPYDIIGGYSLSKMIVIQADKKSNFGSIADTAFYFADSGHFSGSHFSFGGTNYWQLHDSSQTTPHPMNVILKNVEFIQGWGLQDSVFSKDSTYKVVLHPGDTVTDTVPVYLKNYIYLGAQLHVDSASSSPDTILLIELHKAYDSLGIRVDIDSDVVASYAIPWNVLNTTDVVVSSGPIPIHMNVSGYWDGIDVVVKSKFLVGTSIDRIAVWDEGAQKLLAGIKLDPKNTTWINLADTTQSQIVAELDSYASSSFYNGVPDYFYCDDEPRIPQLLSQGRMQKIIREHSFASGLRAGVITEGNGYVDGGAALGKFIHIVQPRVLWQPLGQFVCQGMPFVDHSSDAANESMGGYVKGYFGDDTSSHAAQWYDKPGDLYDVQTGCASAQFLSTAVFDAQQAADSVLTNNTFDSLSSWWGYFAMKAHLDTATLKYTDEYGDNYNPFPEQLSVTANVALSFGARGFTYYDGVSQLDGDYTIGKINIGFLDTAWSAGYDRLGAAHDRTHVFYHRDSVWAVSYSHFLTNSMQQVFDKEWFGGFARCDVQADGNNMKTSTWNSIKSGATPPVDTGAMIVRRYQLADTPTTSNNPPIITETMPSDTVDTANGSYHKDWRWIAYGYWRQPDSTAPTDVDKTTYWILETNLWTNPRDLFCQYHENVDSVYARAGEKVQLGTRILSTKLNLPIDHYYRIALLDSSGWDTIVHGNEYFTTNLKPGKSKLFRVSPDCDLNDVNIVDNNEVSRNNAVHMVKLGAGTYRAVYVRNDSVFMRTVDACTLDSEKLICPSRLDTSVTFGHSEVFRTFCHNPSIAHHRGSADEDMIVFQQSDSSVDGATPTQKILGAVIDHDGNFLTTYDSSLFGHFINLNNDPPGISNTNVALSLSFRACPAVCSNDSGFVFSWSDSTNHINIAAIVGQSGTYSRSQNTLHLNAPFGATPAQNASIAWGTDAVLGTGSFHPQVHLAWEQDSGGRGHIWHQTIEVKYDSGMPLTLWTITNENAERVSQVNGLNCDNKLPCISVSAFGGNSSSVPNIASITWNASVVTDSTTPWRILYRERIRRNTFGAFASYASGVRNYFAPNVFICPADSANASELLTWYSNLNSLHLFTPGDTTIHTYPLTGIYPTLSYSTSMPSSFTLTSSDPYAASFYQTSSLAYHGVIAKHDAVESSGVFYSRSSLVNSVSVEIKHHWAIYEFPCGLPDGISISLMTTFSLSSSQLPLQAINLSSPLPGNGTAENNAVLSPMIVLTLGQPLFISRSIVAADTAALAVLTDSGRSETAYIELLDSATNSVLSVIDSFHVAHSTDTVNRYGTLTFNPNSYEVDFPVYVRARIVADSNVASWTVQTLTKFEGNSDSTGNGGFAKQIMRDAGRAGMVPVADNPIDLLFYPTPANPRTRIMYSVPVDDAYAVTEVRVYSIFGDDVSTLVNEVKPSGRYAYEFNGADLPTGAYVVAVHCGGHMQSKLIHVIR